MEYSLHDRVKNVYSVSQRSVNSINSHVYIKEISLQLIGNDLEI